MPDDGRSRPADRRRIVAGLLEGYRVGLDCVQVLTELVVQLARQRLALGLLTLKVLPGQTAVLGQQSGQPRFRFMSLHELVASFPVSTPGEPGEAACQ